MALPARSPDIRLLSPKRGCALGRPKGRKSRASTRHRRPRRRLARSGDSARRGGGARRLGSSGLATTLALHAVRAVQLAEKDARVGPLVCLRRSLFDALRARSSRARCRPRAAARRSASARGARSHGVEARRVGRVFAPGHRYGGHARGLRSTFARHLGSHRPAIVHGGRRYEPQRPARHRRKRAAGAPTSRRPAHRTFSAEPRKTRRSCRQRSQGPHHQREIACRHVA